MINILSYTIYCNVKVTVIIMVVNLKVLIRIFDDGDLTLDHANTSFGAIIFLGERYGYGWSFLYERLISL